MNTHTHTDIETSELSQYRCDHWKDFAAQVTAKLAGMDLPPITLFFAPESTEELKHLPTGGRTHILLGRSGWDGLSWCVKTPPADGQRLTTYHAPGQGYLRIEGLPECPGDREIREVCSILETLLPQVIENDPVKRAALIERARVAEQARSKAAWVKANLKFFERTLEGTKKAIDQAQTATEKAQQEVVKQIRIREGQGRKLLQLEASRPQVEAKYADEFDRLAELPHVVRVAMDGNKICVFTDRMFVEHGGNRYDIGDFRLEVYTDGSNGGVCMFNLTRTIDGYETGMQGPHVMRSGKPCLGNLKEAIPQYIGEGEYSIVVMLCVQYLQSVNVSDAAGKHINNWPHKAM